MSLFEDLATLEDVRSYVQSSYGNLMGSPRLVGASRLDRLPLAVAEPGPLMAHAVTLADAGGLTLQALRDLFKALGKERFDRGLGQLRSDPLVTERRERRTNRAGRMQEQVVFYGAS